MALFNEPRQWHGFLAAIGRPDLADDPRFATSAARKEHASALVQVLDAVFAQRDLADWGTLLDAAGVTFGAVQSVNETADDKQMQQVGALVPFADGVGLTVSSPFHLEGETKVAPRRAPALGEHTDLVLREAGYSTDIPPGPPEQYLRHNRVCACQGSQTPQSQTDARARASVRVAFHSPTDVGTLDSTAFAARYPAYALPYRLLVCLLTETSARLGADVVR